jgi:hypothetical protein
LQGVVFEIAYAVKILKGQNRGELPVELRAPQTRRIGYLLKRLMAGISAKICRCCCLQMRKVTTAGEGVTGLGALEAKLDATSSAAGLAVVLGEVTTGASRGLRTVIPMGSPLIFSTRAESGGFDKQGSQ